ncbi:UDP:flavonoid glycosyltransferase YjiC (YdhE family) [Diaminobutyricimonas aerilata]|uniref:UDP:flavonoid glycosyltransferase YjiC (YdhE family) n=1 Tax=Diaminobutyricimonas aerilata TaxID=1162967 RepID=A0A2M9CN48_9MICO|nr:nucleotide disphospho-sugar-binding domain-containing protein [Diaminobutyricimonas aerilata]PJJ73320.1 UDP:flavonoid glycosyltransferase YjiC (YdhE family) [Diaminobutyricimonas aerilata]
MSSILFCSTPVIGHIAPLLPVASALADAGHRVRMLTGARYREAVESAGAEWLPLPEAADYDDTRIDELFPGRVGLKGPTLITHDFREIFVRPMEAQAAAVDAALEAVPTDVVLTEALFTGILPLLTRPRSRRPAVLAMGIVPLGLDSRDTAPFGLGIPPLPGAVGRVRNAALRFVAQRVVFASVQRDATARLRGITGHGLPTFVLNWPSLADGIVQFTVPSFEYPRPDLPTEVHFVGPVSRSGRDVPLPAWWSELDGSRPVVHVTQGTIANADVEDLLLPTVRALAAVDVVVVVSTGGRDVAALGELPANAWAAPFLPYDVLLPKTSVLVTNGGYGGVHFAMRHGVPIVIAGQTEDKAEVSARVAWSGVGIDLRSNRPSEEAIRQAVRRVLGEPSYRAASRRIGDDIAAAPGVAGILPLIERYAGSRVE